MVKDFYQTLGFAKKKENEPEEGDSEWEYQIPQDYENKNHVITVIS